MQHNEIAPEYRDFLEYRKKMYESVKQEKLAMDPAMEATLMRVESLQQQIAKIEGNRIWKLVQPFQKLAAGIVSITEKNRHSKADVCFMRYKENLFRQKHPYTMWIREVECKKYDEIPVTTQAVEIETIRFSACVKEKPNLLEQTEYVLLYSDHGRLRKEAIPCLEQAVKALDRPAIIYFDEDFYLESEEERMIPWFKPIWSPDTFLSHNYFGNAVLIRRDCFEKTEWFGAKDCQENIYDMLLQITEWETPQHLDRILYHNNAAELVRTCGYEIIPDKNWDDLQRQEELVKRCLEDGTFVWGCQGHFNKVKERAFGRRNIKAHLESGLIEDQYHVIYDLPENTLISAVVLSKDHPETLELCLKSLHERTDYQWLEIIVVDNGSTHENRMQIEQMKEQYDFQYLYEPMDFNFSKQCNIGVKAAKGELILLLNDDIEVLQKDWLRIMAGQAMQPNTGAVGAKLLYANTLQIQHAGITNMKIGPSHKLMLAKDDVDHYFGRNRLTFDMIGVTAACIVVRKDRYLAVDGFDEEIKVAYNDVDFCFKLHEKGYYNVLRNDAVLYHYESLSRGSDSQDERKWLRLLEERRKLYEKHPALDGVDPFYPNDLIPDGTAYECDYEYPWKDRKKLAGVEEINAAKLANRECEEINLYIDTLRKERRVKHGDKDFFLVDGWFYRHLQDHSQYKKQLLLKRDETYLTVAMQEHYRVDVERILPDEINVALTGFMVRIDCESLTEGTYQVGIYLENEVTGEITCRFTDKTLTL